MPMDCTEHLFNSSTENKTNQSQVGAEFSVIVVDGHIIIIAHFH